MDFKPGIYRHFKGGEYEALFVAKNSEDLTPTVVYRARYGDRGYWTRPLSEWCGTVVRDGVEHKRFTYIGEPEN